MGTHTGDPEMKWKRSELRNRVELGAYRLAKGTVGRAGPGLSEPFGALLGDLLEFLAPPEEMSHRMVGALRRLSPDQPFSL